eukprot:1921046-Pyramimonas_sp.AAC.1
MGGRRRRPPRPKTRKPCKTTRKISPGPPHGGSRQLFSGPGPAPLDTHTERYNPFALALPHITVAVRGKQAQLPRDPTEDCLLRSSDCGILNNESFMRNPYSGTPKKESGPRIRQKESRRRNIGCGILKKECAIRNP